MGRTVGIICESVTDEFTESIDARLSVNVLPSLYFQMCHHAMYMSNSQKVAIFFIPVLIDDLQIYVIDVYI